MEMFLLLAVAAVLISFFAFREGRNTIPDENKEYNTKYSALHRLSQDQDKNEMQLSQEAEEIKNNPSEEDHAEPFIAPEVKMVYMSHGSKKYHKKGCKFIREEENPISVSDAEAMGLTPCKVCKPNLEN
ncbi:hypothetical protein [Ilyobacter polytropus]|uniref:Ada DNA repair metal-binding domain-containing protein n=1 Tax=Ilyobacter polytropus (strain ATCC 51220 / DSM 2926 / LMG 16218 / CuHBu1) TaxID=572544 RepID=E3HCC1_ILYPC|nr:hypothetical protein [Ilyobacter polytropus]ADO84381.1 hypothetical protein Ilyop_2624 [Ilyobacter polytropus DSM 2926]